MHNFQRSYTFFLVCRNFNPKFQISGIINNNPTVKFYVPYIFTYIHICVPINPIRLALVLETKFLYSDFSNVYLFYFYFVIDNQRNCWLAASIRFRIQIIQAFSWFCVQNRLKSLDIRNIIKKSQFPRLIILNYDWCCYPFASLI